MGLTPLVIDSAVKAILLTIIVATTIVVISDAILALIVF